ncbi:chromatin modification-related protein eaf-1-like isoform X6 [Bradysia coprophila]|uniref:chromatin modification-related protein eaf-1-like isoform X6 n=1 Tax=Bradysia coprophila TaxID=38358 RepID=UPI00187DBA10|nr:chromatin modification-related protein eaf-1-like isoform X6 [Bradysia coprophila]
MASMVNMNSLLSGKDSRWLQLEVCREFQRNKCSRPDTECKFAHPPANVEVQNGRVTACYDSIKGRCNREKPPCKYFHPPQHLKDQLLINGRNHLALKNALMQQMGIAPGQPVLPGQVPTVDIQNGSTTVSPLGFSLTFGSQPVMATNPYLTGMPTNTYSPYFAPGHLVPALLGPDPSSVASPLSHAVVPQGVQVAQQKIPRSDRLEMDMKSVGSIYYDNFAFAGMGVPFKRPAAEKSGIPVYQPGATTYQQLMQLQQPFVPVSCEYPSPSPSASSTTNPQSSTANPISNNNINAIVNNSNNSNTNNSNSNAVVTSSPQHSFNNHLASSEQTDKPEQNTSSTPTPELSATATSVISPPLITIPTNHQQPPSSLPSTNPYAVVPYGTATYSTPSIPYSAYSNASIYSHPLTASSSTQSLYADPATIAKEVAQKNYANALKMAAASNAYSGKPLTALSYTGVALNKALIQTPPQTHLPPPTPHQHQTQYHFQAQAQTQSQHPAAAAAAAAAAHNQMVAANQAHVARQMSAAVSQSQYAAAAALTHRPPPMFVQAPHQYLRPHVQTAASALQPNPLQSAAVAAAAQQQLLSQNFFYPGLQGYPLGFGAAQAAAMQAHHLQPSVQQTMPGMPTMPTAQPVQSVNPGAAVVLNPYKKMKTS